MPVYKGYLPVYFKGYGIFGTPQYKPHVSNMERSKCWSGSSSASTLCYVSSKGSGESDPSKK